MSMAWVAFAVGVLIGGVIGVLLMAMIAIAGTTSEMERLSEAYRRGRAGQPIFGEVDQWGPIVKH